MPLIEVLDFDATTESRRQATRAVTNALCDAYEISAEIVSVYFHDTSGAGYGHAGIFGEDGGWRRIFVKLHAFERAETKRELAALKMTEALCTAYGLEPKQVGIYFFDRDPRWVAHGGKLEPAKDSRI